MPYLLPQNEIDRVWEEMYSTAIGDRYWEPLLTRWADQIWHQNHMMKLETRFDDLHTEYFMLIDDMKLQMVYKNHPQTPEDQSPFIDAAMADLDVAINLVRTELAATQRRIHDCERAQGI